MHCGRGVHGIFVEFHFLHAEYNIACLPALRWCGGWEGQGRASEIIHMTRSVVGLFFNLYVNDKFLLELIEIA